MAVTSIWRVKGWLGKLVIYVENPDKTTNPKSVKAEGLDDVLRYAVNSQKTQKSDDEDAEILHSFISGINCHPSTARQEMNAVKKRFGKEGGVVAYHGYQSFAPGEATPEIAHEIGMKLAQELWGNRYQVIVATHLDKQNNKPMTMHVQISLNPTQHYRNLLTTVVGGAGSGKSTRFAMQNLMQCNSSFVVLDPKGELLRTTGGLLEKQGYEIRVLDLLNMEKSHCFNPFAYIHSEADAQKMVTNFFKATTPKGGQSQDPFWDTSASMFLMSLVLAVFASRSLIRHRTRCPFFLALRLPSKASLQSFFRRNTAACGTQLSTAQMATQTL